MLDDVAKVAALLLQGGDVLSGGDVVLGEVLSKLPPAGRSEWVSMLMTA